MTNGPIGSLLLGSLPWRRWQVVVIGAAIAVWIIATIIHLVLVDQTTTMMTEGIPRQKAKPVMALTAAMGMVVVGQKLDLEALLPKHCSEKILLAQ